MRICLLVLISFVVVYGGQPWYQEYVEASQSMMRWLMFPWGFLIILGLAVLLITKIIKYGYKIIGSFFRDGM
jgi:hypothetical protein